MSNNITIAKEYLLNKNHSKILLINIINESINYFYIYLIKYFASNLKLNLQMNNNNESSYVPNSYDLFNNPLIILNTPAIKTNKLLKLNSENKNIFFVDYKIFKNYMSEFPCINSYDIKKDINDFLKNELQLSNNELTNFIYNSPEYTYSEISKILVNEKNYLKLYLTSSDDKITEARKKIFKTKTDSNINIKKLYSLIKKEVDIKKFSFLTS